MASLNKVILIGNLTRDPETRYTSSGTAVCGLGLAVNRRFTTSRGDERDETCFVDIDVWGRQGETCQQYLSKGSPVCVEGRLRYDQWDDRETGRKRSRLTVTAERVQFLGGRAEGGGDPKAEAGERRAPASSAPARAPASPERQPQPPPRGNPPPAFPASPANPDAPPEDEDMSAGGDESIDDIPF